MLAFGMIDITQDKTYQLIEGTHPVLITAPHVFNHKRPSLSASIKQAEPWTDYIAKAVAEGSKSYGLILRNDSSYDPNYQKEDNNPFKQTIRRIVEQSNCKYLIDIHGLHDRHRYDLGIFYERRYYKSKELAYKVAEALNVGKLRGVLIQNFNFPEGGQETLSEFTVHELKIPAVQIEIARYIREDPILREELIKHLTGAVSGLIS